jgi:hypothetical protein
MESCSVRCSLPETNRKNEIRCLSLGPGDGAPDDVSDPQRHDRQQPAEEERADSAADGCQRGAIGQDEAGKLILTHPRRNRNSHSRHSVSGRGHHHRLRIGLAVGRLRRLPVLTLRLGPLVRCAGLPVLLLGRLAVLTRRARRSVALFPSKKVVIIDMMKARWEPWVCSWWLRAEVPVWCVPGFIYRRGLSVRGHSGICPYA